MIGIYKITNKINGKIYIGQSWNIENRFRQHKKNEHNKYLKRSYEKYGIENFLFETVRTFSDSGITQPLLDVFENVYVNQFDARNSEKGYNLREPTSRGKHSEESKKLMSEYRAGKRVGENATMFGKHHSEETKKKQSLSSLGKPKSEEHKKNMSICRKGKYVGEQHPMFGKHWSEEIRAKMGRKGERCGVEHPRARKVKNVDTGEVFDTILEASRFYSIINTSISNALGGRSKTSGGFKWEYVI